MIKKISISILTMFGVGNSKYAPGTVASFITFLIFVFFYKLQVNILILIASVILIFIFSIYSIDKFKKSFSETDASEIVIDEFIGQSIPILTIYNFLQKNVLIDFIFYSFASFVLFRLFDITKPYPIGRIDKEMKNGFGVILDDIVAGIYSVIAFFFIMTLLNYA
jgi:phosphatidylglycerophosphatase A